MLCNIAEDGKCLNQTHAWEFMILDLFLDAENPKNQGIARGVENSGQ